MLEARKDFSLALSPCQQFVFAISGVNSVSIERYTITGNVWETLNISIERPISSCAVATMPDGIYLIGGHEQSPTTDERQLSRGGESKAVLRL